MKRIPIKILSIIIAIVVLMSCFSINTFAYEGEKVTIDLNKSYDSSGKLITWNSNVSGGSKGVSIFHISIMSSSGTKDAYCIQPGTHLNYLDVLTESTSSGAWYSLSEFQRRAIVYAMTFGKDGNSKNLKGNSDEKYVATQLVIWEIVKGYRNASSSHMECANTTYRDAGSKAGSNIRYNYNVISDGLYNAKVIPSFANPQSSKAPTVNLTYDSSKSCWTGSLTDKNKVLSNFNFAGTYSMTGGYTLTVTQIGNTLTLSSNAPKAGTYTLSSPVGSKNVKFPTGGSTSDIVAYTDSKLQDCVGTGSADPPWAYFNVKTIGSLGNDFFIQKEVETKQGDAVENAETLSGWYFYVERTDEHPFSAIVGPTDDLGQTDLISKFSNQPVYNGTYTITELGRLKNNASGKSKSDYYIPGGCTPLGGVTSTYFLGTGLGTATGVVVGVGRTNYIDNPYLRIIKESDNGDVEGFYFKVYDKNNPTSYQIFGPTGSSGFATVRMLSDDINGGIVGTQLVIEELGKRNSNGTYSIPPEFETPQPVEITIEADNFYTNFSSENAITVNFFNTCLGRFKLIKQDRQTKEKLAGATYAVYNSNATDKDGKLLDYAYVTDLTTGSDGTVTSDKLPLGTYYLQETTPPPNHRKDDKVYSVEVVAGSNITPVEIVLEDYPEVGKVTLKKIDSKSKNALSGSEWVLYSSAGGTYVPLAQSGYGGYTYTTSGTKGLTLQTDNNGILTIGNLPYGKYYFKETKAPNNHILSDKKYEFTISDETAEVTITATNTPTTGSVKLNKIDSENGASLAGSEWILYSSAGGTYVPLVQSGYGGYTYSESGTKGLTLETDNNGSLTIGDLPYGSYYLREKKAPFGHVLSTEIYRFTISDSTQNVTITATNAPLPAEVKLVKTSEDGQVADIYFNISDNTGKNYGDFKTDSNGNIDFGTLRVYNNNNAKIQYTVKELGLKNEDGTYTIPYKYNSVDDVTFTLTANETYTVSFENTLKTGSVTLNKQDGFGIELAGAEFELYNSQGELLKVKENEVGNYSFTTDNDGITTVVTDSNGKFVVNNMPQDKGYYFLETKSPSGKMPYANKIPFDIIAESETTLNPELIVKDNNIVMLGTGSIGDIGFGGTAAVLAIVAAAFIVLHFTKNRKRKENVKMHKKHFGAKLLTAMLMTILIVFSSISIVGAAEVNNSITSNILDRNKKVSFTMNCEKSGYTFDVFQVGRLENFETPYETKYSSLVSEIDDSILNGDTATMLSELDKVTVLPDEATKVGTFTTSEQSKSQTISDLEQGIYYVRAVNYPAGVKSVTNSVFALPYYTEEWIYEIPEINLAEKVVDDVPETHKSITNSTKDTENYTDVSLGDTVNFEIRSTTAGSTSMKLGSYVVYDDMSVGLTLDKNSFNVVLLKQDGTKITDLESDEYTVNITSENEGENTVFNVSLTHEYLQTDEFYASDVYYTSVTYSAVLNKYAVVGTVGNPNTEQKLEYSNKNGVTSDVEGNTVYVYTYGLYVDKFNEKAEALSGAEFALYNTYENAENESNAIATGISDSKGKVYFYNANNEEIRLQSGKYFIKETKSPEGFNPYTDVIEITIDVTYGDTFVNGTYVTSSPEDGYASVEVKNTRTVFFKTGGFGNTILYVVATIALVGAILFFAIRKKIKT